jgi:hypothetical protein
MFGCDKALLRVFLEASDWPVGKDLSVERIRPWSTARVTSADSGTG